MAEYRATIRWLRGEQKFIDNKYSRAHHWEFESGTTVPASSSPHVVPLPLSVAEHVDPEESFVASLSSCHMLFFLSLAAEQGIVVDEYVDAATGILGKTADGKMAMTRVILRPRATYSGDSTPAAGTIEALHHQSHELCFIANSVKTEVLTEVVS
jgi:organic hydroperoxide reductase OsmC/OhrA